ncbi:MAG TPA: SDR family oxidoreductase [Rubrobacteraceae bacterium]|nr:SDR family oxidoreductase [Rubrobacteraceae bacterium]
MARKTRDSVVVITGASSGIGRATALAFAEKGASVVLAARRAEALQEVATECRTLGGRALVAPTDVTDEEDVEELARRAVENFGRIDVWVNNAAVTLFGRFEETPSEVYRRVFETNLFGYIHGARGGFPYFREQGSGVLINVSSVVAGAGQPYTSAYVASKFAIRGLSECLRQELILDGARDIHVCNVMPASMDTLLFQHAANYTGRAPKALNPVYSAEKVAGAIVRCARRPKREVVVGSAGRMLAAQHTLSPGLYERAAARVMDRDHFQDRAAPPTEGNLFVPMPGWTGASGGWKTNGGGSARKALLAGAGVAVPVLLGWRWLRDGRASKNGIVARAASWRPG